MLNIRIKCRKKFTNIAWEKLEPHYYPVQDLEMAEKIVNEFLENPKIKEVQWTRMDTNEVFYSRHHLY